MNLRITSLQGRIAVTLADGELTTYELSKKLRIDFWKVQDACRTLWVKGYVDNENQRVRGEWKKRWSLIEADDPSKDFSTGEIPSGSGAYSF